MMTDATLVFIIRCFLSILRMVAHYDKDQSSDSYYVHPFHHPGETEGLYIHIPPVLNKPVQNPPERAFEADVVIHEEEQTLQWLLADSMQCEVEDYCYMLVTWMFEHCSDLHMMEKWLAVHDLDLETYAVHLTSGGTSDGLEVWLTSRAMNRPIMVIMEDTVISTGSASPDFTQLTFLLSHYTHGFLCIQETMEPETMSLLMPAKVQQCALGGHPMVKEVLHLPSPDQGSETDPNELLDEGKKEPHPIHKSGKSKECLCPICQQRLASGLALEWHLKLLHLLLRPYDCMDCDSQFNNL